MGSLSSRTKIINADTQDDNFKVPMGRSISQLIEYMKNKSGSNETKLLKRIFSSIPSPIVNGPSIILDVDNCIRVFQWNILAQSLGQFNDKFVTCPEKALDWDYRKYLIIEEILQYQPDIICLQEVDHYKFIKNILGTLNYDGFFCPKPESPCLFIKNNNGPDGCAIFYRRNRFALKRTDNRILEAWYVRSNQVVLAVKLLVKNLNQEICIFTTHLKARRGVINSKLRNEQGNNLLKFMNQFAGTETPIIIAGDFNAEPTEPVYSTMLKNERINLGSAYADWNIRAKDEKFDCSDNIDLSIENEPPYTTWKIRESGEECHTIDYIFYSKDRLRVTNCLEFPNEKQVGVGRTPSMQYPSDHFSLLCDFEISKS